MPNPLRRSALAIAALAIATAVTITPSLAVPAEARDTAAAPALAGAPMPPAQEVELLAWDDFEDGSIGILPDGWDPEGNFAVGYWEGEYYIYQANPEWEYFPVIYLPGYYGNATLAADVRIVDDTEDRFVSMSCRKQDTELANEYRLLLLPAYGEFALLSIVDGEATELLPWQPTPALRRGGASNYVELSCWKNEISVTLNGITIGAIQDDHFAEGVFTIGTGTLPGAFGTTELRLDNLTIVGEL